MRRLSITAVSVLQAIASGYEYGFDIIDHTGLPSGTVYPALSRLERESNVLDFRVMQSNGGSIRASQARREAGRCVLSGPAVSRIAESALDEIVVTDTIPLKEEAEACPKIRQLSTAELLAETMRRISDEESVSSLYVD